MYKIKIIILSLLVWMRHIKNYVLGWTLGEPEK